MRVIFSFLMLTLASQSLHSQDRLKVISYNVWNGFDWGRDTARKQKLIKWVAEQDADIIAWQELCGYTAENLKEDAAKIGHPFSVLLKESGYPVGITSKHPIELKERIMDGMHHGALHCKVAGVDLFVVHLSPGSYRKRKSEVEVILHRLRQAEGLNDEFLIVGDFNSHSPFDADLYKNNILLNRLRSSLSNQNNNGNLNNNELDYDAMSMLLAFPVVDVIQKFTFGLAERGSFPGRVLGKINNESVEDLIGRLERIDYILASTELAQKCTSAVVFNGISNWYLSDHYPVMAVFNHRY